MLIKRNLLVFTILVWHTFANASPSFLVIVDAGSTGSRLHLYQVNQQAPKLYELYSKKVSPGIASSPANMTPVYRSLAPLLDTAQQKIRLAGGRVRDSKLYLLGTGGMRSLGRQQQARVYRKLQHFLKSRYRFQVADLKTISGKQEAIYGWLAVNDVMGHLNSDEPTYGLLDMGGASVEIAFANPIGGQSTDQVCLGDRCYSICAKSFLHIGLDQSLSELKDDPEGQYCYPKGYPYQQEQLGNYSYDNCEMVARSRVRKSIAADLDRVVPFDVPFIATSGFYYSFNFFHARPTLSDLEQKAREVCEHSTWQELLSEHPEQSSDKIAKYCYSSALVIALLTNPSGFGFDYNKQNLQVANDFEGNDISWAHGAALYLASGASAKMKSITG